MPIGATHMPDRARQVRILSTPIFRYGTYSKRFDGPTSVQLAKIAGLEVKTGLVERCVRRVRDDKVRLCHLQGCSSKDPFSAVSADNFQVVLFVVHSSMRLVCSRIPNNFEFRSLIRDK